MNLPELEQQSGLIFSILTKLSIIIVVAIAIIFIVRVLISKSYSIRHINVPPSFDEMGQTGAVIANRIHFRIQQIIQQVSATEYAKGYITGTTDTDIAVDVAGLGMPVKGFIEMIGTTLGIARSKRIDADFFTERTTVVMILRITGRDAERFECNLTDGVDASIKSLILEAAEAILKHSNDEVLQTYFGLVEQIGEKQITLARYRFEKYRDNPKMEVNIIAAWAWGLCMLKKYDEAEEKILEGIERHRKAGRIYVIWGSLLYQKGKYDDALAKFRCAIDQAAKKETKARISNIYSSMGNCYLMIGNTAAAIECVNKAIAVDSNSSRAYLSKAAAELARGEQELFFENMEKALEKGITFQQISRYPKAAALVEEERMQKLLRKYAEV
jgi:tetratricopeptide (TPR) repeat protein